MWEEITYPFPNLTQWNLEMDKKTHPTLYWACDYLSILDWLMLIHVSKMDLKDHRVNVTQEGQRHITTSQRFLLSRAVGDIQ